MHANVYRERPDVNAIVHTHQPYASALAFLRKQIPALTDEQVRFLGRRGRDHRLRPVGHRLPGQERAEEGRQRRQRVHHRQPRHRRAGHRPRPRGVQHGAAGEGLARLPAGADHRAGKVYTIPDAIREIAFTKLRKDEKRIAAQITEAVAPVRVPADEAAAERRREGRRGRRAGPTADDRLRGRRAPRRARLRDQRVPRRRRHDAPAQGAGGPAGARAAARRDARRAQLLRDQVPGQQGDHRPGQAAASPAASSTTWPSTTRSRSRSTRPRAPTSPTATATPTSTSCRPAARRCSAATTARSTSRSPR